MSQEEGGGKLEVEGETTSETTLAEMSRIRAARRPHQEAASALRAAHRAAISFPRMCQDSWRVQPTEGFDTARVFYLDHRKKGVSGSACCRRSPLRGPRDPRFLCLRQRCRPAACATNEWGPVGRMLLTVFNNVLSARVPGCSCARTHMYVHVRLYMSMHMCAAFVIDDFSTFGSETRPSSSRGLTRLPPFDLRPSICATRRHVHVLQLVRG